VTPDQQTIHSALQTVSFQLGSPHKRFVRDLKADQVLSEKQDKYLRDLAVRYRRQIRDDTVALARAGGSCPST
jgi:hypothetical protein